MPPRISDGDDVVGDDPHKLSVWERLRYTMVKPDNTPSGTKQAEPEMSRQELEAAIARADDKERNVGFVAAPLGALIGLLITGDLINHARSLNESTTTYQTLTFVLLGMSLLMLVTAWLRKRLFLGIVLALFGLGIFNLKYWGFGIPFLMAGAWLLVRAYRLQRDLKEATGEGPGSQRGQARGRGPTNTARPKPNKRYTPPTGPPKKTPPKSGDEKKAG